jgi:hypothetical protein
MFFFSPVDYDLSAAFLAIFEDGVLGVPPYLGSEIGDADNEKDLDSVELGCMAGDEHRWR